MPTPNKPENRIVTVELSQAVYEALEQYRRAKEKEHNRFVSKREIVGAAIVEFVGASAETQ